jgi:hypothetical protein
MDQTTLSIVHLPTSSMWFQIKYSFGPIQATSPHQVLLWTHPSHRSTLVLPWTIQATSSPQCSLELIQATDPPSAPLDYPSHRSTPVGVVLLHCTRLQCSLHFCAYTLAMQSMVSPFKHPSRYIIINFEMKKFTI